MKAISLAQFRIAMVIGVVLTTSASCWGQHGKLLHRLDGDVYAVTYSPDGSSIFSAGRAGNINIWNRDLEEVVQIRILHDKPITCLSLSPDGTLFVVGTNRSAEVWTVEEPRRIADLQFPVTAVGFFPDSATVALATRGAVALWDLRTNAIDGELPHEWVREGGRTFESAVCSLAISPDGRRLVTGCMGDPLVRLWDVGERRLERQLANVGDRGVSGLAFSRQGDVIAGTNSTRGPEHILFWHHDGMALDLVDTVNERPLHSVTCLAWSPTEALLASVGADLIIWNTDTLEVLFSLQAADPRAQFSANVCAFSPDGETLAVGGHDGWIRVYSITKLVAER